MKKNKFERKLKIYILILSVFLPLSFTQAFSILSSNKYAWSDQVGYINFAPANGGVAVTNTALSGYAWSENTGYINFAPAESGVLNDGTGNLSGSAWGEGVGYIDFSNVSIDPTTGLFSGTATGTVVGTLTFDCGFCDVRTDWRPTIATSSASGGRVTVAPKLLTPPTPPALTKITSPLVVPQIAKETEKNIVVQPAAVVSSSKYSETENYNKSLPVFSVWQKAVSAVSSRVFSALSNFLVYLFSWSQKLLTFLFFGRQ